MHRTQRIIVPIHGLPFGEGVARAVERALARMPGVERAYVDPATHMAHFECDPALASPDLLVSAVELIGLRAGPAIRR